MLLKVISSVHFLLWQGLAIRGHRESDGNLINILQLRSEDDSELATWLKNQQYLSPDIINQIISLLGNALLQQLLSSIREARWFAILADETTNITKHEQLSLTIQWVSSTYEVNKDFISLVLVPQITADILTTAIKDFLKCCALPLAQC